MLQLKKKYRVFSAHLIQKWFWRRLAETRKEPSQEEIDKVSLVELVNNANRYDPYLLTEIPHAPLAYITIQPIYERCSYKLITTRELRRINEWIAKNIIGGFGKDRQDTMLVKIRIATDMLNKLMYQKVITKEQNIYFHDCFVKNILDLYDDFNNELEELPF